MKTIRQDRLGGVDVLEVCDASVPRPSEGEVLVRVCSAGVNPVDWKTRQLGGLLGEPPFVLGWDVSGVVVDHGRGVDTWTVGDDAVGLLRFPEEARGYAEYVTAPVDELAAKPAGVSHLQAAALPLAGLTAWQALVDVAGVDADDRILIHAGAGGVGHLAVQLAAGLGAHVIATASRPNHRFLHDLGVERALDYRDSHWNRDVEGLDVVLDPFGGQTSHESLELLASGGVLVTLKTSVSPDLQRAATARGIRAAAMVVRPDSAQLAHLLNLVAQGRLNVHVDRSYPLEDVAEAHVYGEKGHVRGKLVLTVEG